MSPSLLLCEVFDKLDLNFEQTVLRFVAATSGTQTNDLPNGGMVRRKWGERKREDRERGRRGGERERGRRGGGERKREERGGERKREERGGERKREERGKREREREGERELQCRV